MPRKPDFSEGVQRFSSAMPTTAAQAKKLVRTTQEVTHRLLATAGFRQAEETIAGEAQEYWHTPAHGTWRANSHWRDADVFDGNDLWSRIGREHLELFESGARMAGLRRPWKRVLEWGCGGGANAVHFAPLAAEFIGVDISAETLKECEKQVTAVCDTPTRSIAIDVADPESAVAQVEGWCDVFLSFYVFELIPSQEYGQRLLRIAAEVLRPGGLALVQIKYDPGHWRTKPRRRSYRSGLAEMTTYPIDTFWQVAGECGLTPVAVHLVPKNELDERYAYFFMRKPDRSR